MSDTNAARLGSATQLLDAALTKGSDKRSRTYRTSNASWVVCEDQCPIRLEPCLIFYGPGVARRVMSYPADWHTLDDAGLALLSMNR